RGHGADRPQPGPLSARRARRRGGRASDRGRGVRRRRACAARAARVRRAGRGARAAPAPRADRSRRRPDTRALRGLALRASGDGVEVDDALGVALDFLSRWPDSYELSQPYSFDERDLRLANRGGARISAAEIAAILARRKAIEQALDGIPVEASLTDARVRWT